MTDLDLEAEITFSAALAQDFRPFTAPAHPLREIVSKLPDGAHITIEAKDDKQSPDSVTVKSGRSRFALQSLPPNDFSSMNLGQLTFSFTMQHKHLLAAIGAVGFAISTEETRYYLNGIFIHVTEVGMLFVATDGHRLAKRFVAIDDADSVLSRVRGGIPDETIRLAIAAVMSAAEPFVAVKALSGDDILAGIKDQRFGYVVCDGKLTVGTDRRIGIDLDKLADFLSRSSLTAQVQDVATHRHKERGSEYVLIGIGKIKAEDWFDWPNKMVAMEAVDMREVAIYRSVDDGSLWVRHTEEFNDGRFEVLSTSPAKQEG